MTPWAGVLFRKATSYGGSLGQKVPMTKLPNAHSAPSHTLYGTHESKQPLFHSQEQLSEAPTYITCLVLAMYSASEDRPTLEPSHDYLYLPRLPPPSHDYLLPPTTTCYLPTTTCCLSRLPATFPRSPAAPPKEMVVQ